MASRFGIMAKVLLCHDTAYIPIKGQFNPPTVLDFRLGQPSFLIDVY